MKDLLESSQIFEASSRLQSAAATLRRIESHSALSANERANLKWSGRFLKEVDWGNEARNTTTASGELSVQATEVRPSFYAVLLNIRPLLKNAGITEPDQLEDFLSSTYQLLTGGGAVRRKATLTGAKVDLAASFLEELAKALLVRLTGNGVPEDADLHQFSIA